MTDLVKCEEPNMNNASGDVETANMKLRHLSLCRRLCFSVGHMLNDITASMWFTYLLVYLHAVMKFDSVLAGYLMLLGQLVDGISTPLVGYESDRTQGCWKLGRRKTWYLLGTCCVVFSFPFLFNPAIDGQEHTSRALFVYYAPFVTIFQFGWASTQISHLALIPELTPLEDERVELNALRYGCTVLANIFVFGVAWLMLSLHHLDVDTGNAPLTYNTLQPQDAGRFRILVFVVMAVGLFVVTIFFFVTKEKKTHAVLDESGRVNMKWKCWLKEPQFYQVSMLYMCSRIYTNISQIYLPMFLLMTVNLSKASIATIPLIVFASGFVAAIIMKKVNLVLGRKVTYFIGALVAACACVEVYFLKSSSKQIYFVACLIGFGGSTMLVTALSMTADLISSNTETGAFVYGAFSFTDKLSNGIAVVVIQHLHPDRISKICGKCASFYRLVLTYVPAGTLIVSTVVLATLISQTIGTRRKLRKKVVKCAKQNGLVNEESKALLYNDMD